MIGVLIYYSIVQYIVCLVTFIIMLSKKYVFNNYFALIPVVGSKSALNWLYLSFEIKGKTKEKIEEEIIKEKADDCTVKIRGLYGYLFKGYYRISGWSFDDCVDNFNNLKDYAINLELFENVNKCIQLFRRNKSNKVSELFINMIDTLCSIFQVDSDTKISDDVIQEIIDLCNNYHGVMNNIISKEKKEKEENSNRKSEKYNHYVKSKIKSINMILKEVDKDMKY